MLLLITYKPLFLVFCNSLLKLVFQLTVQIVIYSNFHNNLRTTLFYTDIFANIYVVFQFYKA